MITSRAGLVSNLGIVEAEELSHVNADDLREAGLSRIEVRRYFKSMSTHFGLPHFEEMISAATSAYTSFAPSRMTSLAPSIFRDEESQASESPRSSVPAYGRRAMNPLQSSLGTDSAAVAVFKMGGKEQPQQPPQHNFQIPHGSGAQAHAGATASQDSAVLSVLQMGGKQYPDDSVADENPYSEGPGEPADSLSVVAVGPPVFRVRTQIEPTRGGHEKVQITMYRTSRSGFTSPSSPSSPQPESPAPNFGTRRQPTSVAPQVSEPPPAHRTSHLGRSTLMQASPRASSTPQNGRRARQSALHAGHDTDAPPEGSIFVPTAERVGDQTQMVDVPFTYTIIAPQAKSGAAGDKSMLRLSHMQDLGEIISAAESKNRVAAGAGSGGKGAKEKHVYFVLPKSLGPAGVPTCTPSEHQEAVPGTGQTESLPPGELRSKLFDGWGMRHNASILSSESATSVTTTFRASVGGFQLAPRLFRSDLTASRTMSITCELTAHSPALYPVSGVASSNSSNSSNNQTTARPPAPHILTHPPVLDPVGGVASSSSNSQTAARPPAPHILTQQHAKDAQMLLASDPAASRGGRRSEAVASRGRRRGEAVASRGGEAAASRGDDAATGSASRGEEDGSAVEDHGNGDLSILEELSLEAVSAKEEGHVKSLNAAVAAPTEPPAIQKMGIRPSWRSFSLEAVSAKEEGHKTSSNAAVAAPTEPPAIQKDLSLEAVSAEEGRIKSLNAAVAAPTEPPAIQKVESLQDSGGNEHGVVRIPADIAAKLQAVLGGQLDALDLSGRNLGTFMYLSFLVCGQVDALDLSGWNLGTFFSGSQWLEPRNLGGAGAATIGAVLEQATGLSKLRLDMCNLAMIQIFSFVAQASAKTKAGIETVSLGANGIKDAGVADLASAIGDHASLSKLHLWNNLITATDGAERH
eukprot:gene23912-9483_t